MFTSTAPTIAATPFIAVALAYLVFAIRLSWIDVREHRLPNVLTLALNGAVLAVGAITALAIVEYKPRFMASLILALALGVLAVGIALVFPSSIGMGDAKVIPALVFVSVYLGSVTALLGALAWVCVVGGIAALIVAVKSGSTKTRFAFGPVLLSAPLGGIALATVGALPI